MNYSNIKYFCTVNGTGVRTAIFVSGCDLHCNGCFNKITWGYDQGKELSEEVIDKILKSVEATYVDGISILGGEPLANGNLDGVLHIVNAFREKFGNTKTIWLWTGRTLEEAMSDAQRMEILEKCDFVVDGRFEIGKANPNLKFRGSSNQIIWEKDKESGEFVQSILNNE